ncbi:MAG: acylphosphatase [Pirellulales bacterium]
MVHYAGRVQGVGFRYCARQTADGFAVSGFVRNLPDGRVHLVVEGESAVLEAFLAELAARMGRNIRHTEDQAEAPTGEFSAFEIRF